MTSVLGREALKERLASIVGPEKVLTDPETLEKYSTDQSFVEPRMPLLVVQPGTTKEVQEILKLANHLRVPVTPYTSGMNNQGASIPTGGGIVVDTSKMNKIIDIDEVHRVATVEVGVTFNQLQDEAKKHGLRVLTPAELPASASVVTTYIEYVPLYSWPRYEEENLLTMHLVLPTGEIMKTGAAAVPAVRPPYDPMGAAVFSFLNKIWFGAQGTLGIVTRAVVKLKTLYKENEVFFIPFEEVKDVIKPLREIQWSRIGEERFVTNSTNLSLTIAEKVPEDFIELRPNLPPWTLVLVLRGSKERVEYEKEDLKELSSKLKVELMKEVGGRKEAEEMVLKEIAYPGGWRKTSQYKGASNTLPFIVPAKRIVECDKVVQRLAERHEYPREDIGCTLIPANVSIMCCQLRFARDPTKPEETEKTRKLFYETANQLLMTTGAFFSRPYGPLAELVYSRAPTYYSTIRKFKQMVDPNEIMAPGKIFIF